MAIQKVLQTHLLSMGNLKTTFIERFLFGIFAMLKNVDFLLYTTYLISTYTPGSLIVSFFVKAQPMYVQAFVKQTTTRADSHL